MRQRSGLLCDVGMGTRQESHLLAFRKVSSPEGLWVREARNEGRTIALEILDLNGNPLLNGKDSTTTDDVGRP